MEHLNAKLDNILTAKYGYILNKKMTVTNKEDSSIVDKLNYSVQTTLYKINAEQDKKLKASKAYKKKEQIFN